MKLTVHIKNYFFTSTLILIFASSSNCSSEKQPNKQEDAYKSIAVNQQKKADKEIELKKQLLAGDTMAYYDLRRIYVSDDRTVDFLPWALIMANKFKLEVANYDVFFCIQEVNHYYGYSKETKKYSNFLDSATIEFSRIYLNKMSDKEEVQSDWDFYTKEFLK